MDAEEHGTHEEDPSLAAPAGLDREKTLSLAAIAADAWAGRLRDPTGTSSRDVLELAMRAAAWASRARLNARMEPLALADFVKSLEHPLGSWIPGAPEIPLLENGEPTALCAELVDEAGSSPLAEVEQGVIVKAMNHLGVGADASARYTNFRRFLVENATALVVEAARTAREVGVDLADLYGPVPVNATVRDNGADYFYPCPRCRWPLRIRGDSVSCAVSSSCLAAGARYRLDNGALLPLHGIPAPPREATTGRVALRNGVWRYTTLPGLEEVGLAERLSRVPGVSVELWPLMDAYDLDVRKGAARWRIDVKDHVSATGLARRLADRPRSDLVWIVVPDNRRDQPALLERLVPTEAGYRFTYTTAMLRRVRGAS